MKDINLTELLTRDHKRENKIDRFNSSEVWAILNGYITPKEYLFGKKLEMKDIKTMWRGTIKHKALESYLKELGWETEVKTEINYKPDKEHFWTLVGKADGIKENEVLELKTSEKIINQAKPWQEFQVKLYCSLFNKEIGGIYQPIFTKDQFLLRLIGEVKKNDKWFREVIEKLNDFYKKLLDYERNKNS